MRPDVRNHDDAAIDNDQIVSNIAKILTNLVHLKHFM